MNRRQRKKKNIAELELKEKERTISGKDIERFVAKLKE